jgi:pimeloyl-ACP methyl ester carboxylesterase
MIYALPGMGADNSMYGAAWRGLPNSVFLNWPAYHGEDSIASIAKRVVDEAGIADGSVLIGSSLGGIVSCEIAKIRELRGLILVGGAKTKEEISSVLSLIHPLAKYAPIEFIQRAAGKLPSDLTRMFTRGQAPLIRAMCNAIFEWEGLDEALIKPVRIHGRFDRVIPLPANVDLILDAGHLVAMTHPRECVAFISANQLPDPTSPSVTPAAGAAGAPSVAADH